MGAPPGTDLLVVSGEALWPLGRSPAGASGTGTPPEGAVVAIVRGAGRRRAERVGRAPGEGGASVRMAGLVEALALRFAVRVVAPVEAAPPDGIVVGVDGLPDEDPVARLVAVLSPQPRLGHAFLGPRRSRALLQAVADHRPGAVLFAAGYLAAAAPTIDRPIFVDFPYLSVRRDAPDRSVSAFESLKARWWEPVEARRAVAVSASTPEDVARLASWGARALLVPDGSTSAPLVDAIEEVVRAPRTAT